MDLWSPKLQLATWTAMRFLCVFSHEATVKYSDLKLCEDDERVCVTDLRDCGPREPASPQETLNVSCCYQMSLGSVTCEWSRASNSRTESDASLLFSSEEKIDSCQGIFNPAAVLNVTARIRDYAVGREIWSRPHPVVLYDAVKPPRPVLSLRGSTEDSVVASWRSSGDAVCRLRYRVHSTHSWTQAPDSVPADQDQTLNYTIKDLLVSTVYSAAVACRQEAGVCWSDWSTEVSARTLDTAPSRPPEVCYRVEETDSGGTFRLHLMWKELDLRDAGGRILGYQVSYEPAKKKTKKHGCIQNVTEVTALLVVEEGNCTVTVAAYNAAGHGPAARLSIDPQRRTTLQSVRHLWVSSSFPVTKDLLVQWENPKVPPSSPPVSHLVVQWHSETQPSNGTRWTTVDNVTTSAVIRDVDPDEFYLISVFPVYNQQCGPARSLPAGLQQGALMEAVQLKVVGVTKTTVKVVWVWQRKAGPIRVHGYRAMLRKDSESHTRALWPDQWQLTFLHLNPDTEYSLLLLADDTSRSITPVRTDFDEVPAVAAATPLMLLAVIVLIISILSRTLYKSYFFPLISGPLGSSTGRWLMDPNRQATAGGLVLDLEDFQVTGVLGEKSLIAVCPNSLKDLYENLHQDLHQDLHEDLHKDLVPDFQQDLHEDLHQDAPLLSIVKPPALRLDTEYVLAVPVDTGPQLVFPQFRRADPEEEESSGNRFPPGEDEAALEEETAVNLNLCGHGVHGMTCEAEYVATGGPTAV